MCSGIFLLLIILWSAAAAAAQTKENCNRSCGNISDIPYPFGIGEECAREGFHLTCNYTTDPPKTFLGASNVEITEIRLQQGQVILNMYRAIDCYDISGQNTKRTSPSMNLGTYPYPYVFSDTNMFAAIGCDTYAYISSTSDSDFTNGCLTTCRKKSMVKDGPCSSVGCCEIPTPKGLRYFKLTLTSFANHRNVVDFNPCSYAFLVERRWFNFRASNIFEDSIYRDNYTTVPVVVDWSVANQTCEEARSKATDYACKSDNSYCYISNSSAPGYLCNCSSGYDGNPYVPDGCRDVNECANTKKYPCYGDCINHIGSYNCSCPKGKRGDPTREGGCSEKFPGLKVLLGVILLSILVIVLIITAGIAIHKRRVKKIKAEYFENNGGLELKNRIEADRGIENNLRIFTKEELDMATDKFDSSHKLGQGGQGEVYKGNIHDVPVAIKKFLRPDKSHTREFINEVILLSQINDTNLVKLIGCCLDMEDPMLVYEFIAGGTLFKYIREKAMSWRTCIKVALDTAIGLNHLHSRGIVHGDVKSLNVLVTEDFTAKVSDFGTSRLTRPGQMKMDTMLQGTPGYMDPEYLQTQQLTEKSDVYSFGVVLLELLTRRPPTSVVPDFLRCVRDNRLNDLLEETGLEKVAPDQYNAVARIAESCLRMKGEDRSTMKVVISKLRDLMVRIPDEERQYREEVFAGGFPEVTEDNTASLTRSAVYHPPEAWVELIGAR